MSVHVYYNNWFVLNFTAYNKFYYSLECWLEGVPEMIETGCTRNDNFLLYYRYSFMNSFLILMVFKEGLKKYIEVLIILLVEIFKNGKNI